MHVHMIEIIKFCFSEFNFGGFFLSMVIIVSFHKLL